MPRSRSIALAVVSATALATTAAVSLPTSAPAQTARQDQQSGSLAKSTAAAPKSTSGTEHVIVVLRDQLTAKPAKSSTLAARKAAGQSGQNAVLSRLSGAKPTQVSHFTVGNAFAATVTNDQAAELAADPAVASVSADKDVQVAPPTPGQAPSAQVKNNAKSNAVAPPAAADPRACSSDPKKPLLEPEALQTMRVRSDDPTAKTAAALGIDGTGVKVAYIADGINPNNAGLLRKNGKSAVVDYKDFYGDGPNAPGSGAEAFGDASAIAAQGNVTYDVADYSNPASVSYPTGHCYIRIVGVAPGASIVALKGGSELLPTSAILQSIDYAVTTAKVDVINESFGGDITPDSSNRDAIQAFNDNAVKAGITVTVSTGDAGITGTNGSPSTDPLVISASASTDNRIYEQTNYALATTFGNGTWQNDNTSSLSSAGITQAGRVPDIQAPGEADWAICDDSGNWIGCTSFGNKAHPFSKIQAFGGTSQSAPFTAGVAALVIQAYRSTHGGTSATPAVVKQIITSTAADHGLPGDEGGSGRIDARAAVEAALTWPGATTAAPKAAASNIALSTNQLTLTGDTGSTQSGTVRVTNVGNKPLTIATNTRKQAVLSKGSKTATMSTDLPTVAYPTNGAPWNYQKITFDVPSGADELASSIRWVSGVINNKPGPVVRLSLFDPNGAFASNTRPQGGTIPANFGLSTVKKPMAGTWTAVLYTPVSGGFDGPVTLTNTTFRNVPAGSISPLTKQLAPGASTPVKISVQVPTVGGDTVDTASIASSDGHQVAVPVVVRALVPKGKNTFAGVITGGNARGARAQTFSYAMDVPSGKNNLMVGVTLRRDTGILLKTELVDPHGEIQSVGTNETSTANGTTSRGKSLQNLVAKPIAGRWHYVVSVINPVTGKEDAEPFTGSVGYNKVKVVAPALPKTLAQGKKVTVKYQVTNNTGLPLELQTDAHAGAPKNQQLAPLFAGNSITLPQSVEDLSQLPAYLVPPTTTRVSVTAASSLPAQVELSSPGGGIDAVGDLDSAKNGSTISTATVRETTGTVGTGLWSPYVQEIGPFSGPAPAGTSTLTGSARFVPFDTAVQSKVGDPFLAATDATADGGSPLIVAPGATVSVPVTITPNAAKGSTVTGTLSFVTSPTVVANLFYTTGEVFATTSYSYKVK